MAVYIENAARKEHVVIGAPAMTRLRIRELLDQRGMPLAEFAQKMAMSKQNAERFVNEETSSYKKETLNDAAWVLHCRVADLFEGDPETPEFVRQLLAEEEQRRQSRQN